MPITKGKTVMKYLFLVSFLLISLFGNLTPAWGAIHSQNSDFTYYTNNYHDFNGQYFGQNVTFSQLEWFRVKPAPFFGEIGYSLNNNQEINGTNNFSDSDSDNFVSSIEAYFNDQLFGSFFKNYLSPQNEWREIDNVRLSISRFSNSGSTFFLGIDSYSDYYHDVYQKDSQYTFCSPGYRYDLNGLGNIDFSFDYASSSKYGSEIRGYEVNYLYTPQDSMWIGQIYWDVVKPLIAVNMQYNFQVNENSVYSIGLKQYGEKSGFLTGLTWSNAKIVCNAKVERDPYRDGLLQFIVETNYKFRDQTYAPAVGLTCSQFEREDPVLTFKFQGVTGLFGISLIPIDFWYSRSVNSNQGIFYVGLIFRPDDDEQNTNGKDGAPNK
jgi:hypothetical protein